MVNFGKFVPHFIAGRFVRPHSVLTDPAILRAIFEQLIDVQDERDTLVHARPQLLRLATCCKAFSEPALDILWRKMDDLLPLLKILPSFQKVDDAYTIRGAVNERDLARFRRYANRIQELVHCPGDSNRQFGAFVYFSIGQLCGMKPLLRSLRKLHCFATAEMLLFSTSALSHVKVETKISDEDQMVEQFLRMLIDRNPIMMDLTIIGYLSTGSLNALCGFTSLRSLTLRDTVTITIPVLQAIAAFPLLFRMEIDLRDMGPVTPSVWDPAAFPSLEDLTVYGTLGWCNEILGALSTPILKSVCISVAERSYHMKIQTFAIGWYNYFQRLQSMSFRTLRRVQVGYVGGVSISGEPIYFKIHGGLREKVKTRVIMQPLLRISALESVRFTSWPSLPLSDPDVCDIALAWPKLVELCLPDAAVEKPSIASIVYLIASCPLLISLNATLYLDHLESADFPPICTRALCAWAANDPHPGRLACLARHLNRVLASPRSEPTYQRITITDLFHICRSLSPDEASQLFPTSAPWSSSVMVPTKLSDDERVIMSNDSSVASGPAGLHFERAAQMVSLSNQGGPGGSGPGPGRAVTGSKRGKKRHRNDKVGARGVGSLGRHGPEFTGGFGAGYPLTPETLVHSAIAVDRKVRMFLNKLTVEQFDSVTDDLIAWVNKSKMEKGVCVLKQVVETVFERATTDEDTWSEMYARLCQKMVEQISPSVQDDEIENAEGISIGGGRLFRIYLLNKCQEEFELGCALKEIATSAAPKTVKDAVAAKNTSRKGERVVLSLREYHAVKRARRKGLGLIKFIGELFKLQMLTERIMRSCIEKLLVNVNDSEEEIERLCVLLAKIGAILETNKARTDMNVYFSRMQEFVKSPNVSVRMQFMLQDVIDLRERKWASRNTVAAPSMFAPVCEAACKEKVPQEDDSK